MARRHAHAKPVIQNRKPLAISSLHLCSRVPHGPRKISRYVGDVCRRFFCGDVASHVSRRAAARAASAVASAVACGGSDGSRSLSLIFFPGAAGRRRAGRGARCMTACERRIEMRFVSLHCDCLDYNFVRVSVISLQSAPWAARQTTQESAPAGGACSSGTSRCARRSVCLVALRHISWATGSGRVPRARSLIYATPA